MAYEVHPVAALFPMFAEDELAELAASIEEHGLDDPIVLDVEGHILDGRNRLAACKIAGVEPRFRTYEGEDAADYALRHGINRRHLTTGARAVLAEQARRLNGQTMREAAAGTNLYHARLAEAALVLDFAPERVAAIVTGAEPLSVVVPAARARKADAERLQAKRDRLHADAPDLAELVGEGRMGLDDAIAALDAREAKARQEAEELASAEERERRQREQEHRDAVGRSANRLHNFLDGFNTAAHLAGDPNRDDILDALTDHDRERFLTIEKETTWPSTRN